MHLNEFADSKVYALSAGDMAAVLNQLDNIWLDRRLEDDSTLILRPRERPENRRRKLMDEWRRDGINRQSRRQHLSPPRSR